MSLKGERLLKNEQYQDGVATFKSIVREEPRNPEAQYYLGRFYLALERPEEGLPHLKQAVQGDPSKADYYFWLGVAYWAVMEFEKERLSYQRALALEKNHIPALLYLGHNLLDEGAWKKALAQYDIVLQKDRYNPEALYNRGLALQQLDRPDEEIDAWKGYLKHYPDGRWALRATDHLNALGDFSYRNFTIGYRRVTLARIPFSPGSAELPSRGKPSIQVLGSILSINEKIGLEISGYEKNDPALATARAKAVRDYLLQHFPTINPSRLKYGGKGDAEKVEIGDRTYRLNESISFVTTSK